MLGLAALLVATPIWGFALQPPTAPPLGPAELTVRDIPVGIAASPGDVAVVAPLRDPLQPEKISWSRAIVLSTAAAMATTVVLGAVQFSDEYGFHARYGETPCAQGTAVLDQCGDDVAWQHLVAASVSAGGVLFGTLKSLFLWWDDLAQVDTDWRIYETTRWVVVGLTVVQATFGALLANAVRLGWADRENDFETLQGLALGHLALGAVTLGVQVANAVVLF